MIFFFILIASCLVKLDLDTLKSSFFPCISECDDDGGGFCLCVGGGGGGVVYPATSSIMIVCLDCPPSNHNI